MSNTWDEYAHGWDTNQDVRHYSQKAFDELLSVKDIRDLRIFEFGCGTGLLTEKMAHHCSTIVALDTSPKMCRILKKKNLKNVVVLEDVLTEDLIKTEPLLKRPFDLIVSLSVFAFVDDLCGVLKILKSLLDSDGLLVHWDWKKSEHEPDFGFSRHDLVTAYQHAGMEPIRITEPFSIENEKGSLTVIMGVIKKCEINP